MGYFVLVLVLVLVLDPPVLPGLPVLSGLPVAGACIAPPPRRMIGRACRCGVRAALESERGGEAASTTQTPGTDAKRSVWPPRVAHYVRKRF